MKTCLLITTFNRSRLLEKNLERLSGLTQPDEILVVDDGGNDGCAEVCGKFGARYIYTNQPFQAMCSHARNVGLNHTDADLIITCEPELLYVTDVIGQFLARHVERPMEVISAGVVHHMQSDGGVQTIVNWQAPYTALYRRDWLMAVRGWDESFPDPWGWDDVDLASRLRLTGIGQFVDPDVGVTHQYHEPGYYGFSQDANEQHFRSKGDDPVANRDLADWGQPKR